MTQVLYTKDEVDALLAALPAATKGDKGDPGPQGGPGPAGPAGPAGGLNVVFSLAEPTSVPDHTVWIQVA